MSKGRSQEERGNYARTSCIMTRSQTRSMRLKNERLFPGIPDDIVLSHIVTKLPMGALDCLSLVNHRWQLAFRSREIYDARIRSHSADTFVAINHEFEEGEAISAISLYSVRDNCWNQLPQFPKPPKYQRLIVYQCVSIDGKIYALGGVKDIPESEDDDSCYIEACSNVYVLDLFGRRKWKKCKNMPQPRYQFQCGVVDGKIFVFGGKTSGSVFMPFMSFGDSVAYDPNDDSWSAIMPLQKIEQRVLSQPQVHLPTTWDQWEHYLDSFARETVLGEERKLFPRLFAMFELLFPVHPSGAVSTFVAQGERYVLTSSAIFGIGKSAFEPLRTSRKHTVKELSFLHSNDVCPIQAVNGELLAITRSDAQRRPAVLLQSKGFRSENKTISWLTVPSGIEKLRFPEFLCSIEL